MKHEFETKFNIGDKVYCAIDNYYSPSVTKGQIQGIEYYIIPHEKIKHCLKYRVLLSDDNESTFSEDEIFKSKKEAIQKLKKILLEHVKERHKRAADYKKDMLKLKKQLEKLK